MKVDTIYYTVKANTDKVISPILIPINPASMFVLRALLKAKWHMDKFEKGMDSIKHLAR